MINLSGKVNVLPDTIMTTVNEISGINKKSTSVSNLLLNKTTTHGRRRRRYKARFDANHTIARRYDFPLGHDKLSHSLHINKKTKESQDLCDRIQDHAYRRIQLFYYLMVAYYQEKCHIEIDRTAHQHGVAECRRCSAAHSSILPNVKDNFFELLIQAIQNKKLHLKTEKKLMALGIQKERIHQFQTESMSVKSFLSVIPKRQQEKLLTKNNHFYNSMNSTVELPQAVNNYDCIIENNLRSAAVEILNLISFGKVTPYHGLEQFIKTLECFFEKSASEISCKKNVLLKAQHVICKLWKMENDLKANVPDNVGEWVHQYIELCHTFYYLKETLRSGHHSPRIRIHFLRKTDQVLQLYSLSQLFQNQFIEEINSLSGLVQYIDNSLKGYQKYCDHALVNSIKDAMSQNNYSRAKVLMKMFWEQVKPLVIYLNQPDKTKEMFALIHRDIVSAPFWQLPNYSENYHLLEENLAILKAQQKGSSLPPYVHLTNNGLNRAVDPNNESDLFEQKLEIIKRV